jgi:hypothetical protein
MGALTQDYSYSDDDPIDNTDQSGLRIPADGGENECGREVSAAQCSTAYGHNPIRGLHHVVCIGGALLGLAVNQFVGAGIGIGCEITG